MSISDLGGYGTASFLTDLAKIEPFEVPTTTNGVLFVLLHAKGDILSVDSVKLNQTPLILINGTVYNNLGTWLYYLLDPIPGLQEVTAQMSQECDVVGMRAYLFEGIDSTNLIEQSTVGYGTGSNPSDRFKLTNGNLLIGSLFCYEPADKFIQVIDSLIEFDRTRIHDPLTGEAFSFISAKYIAPSSTNQDIGWELTDSGDFCFVIGDINYGV